MSKDDKDATAETPKKSKKMLMIIILAVALFGGGGAGAYFFFKGNSAEAAEVELVKGAVVAVEETMTINLADAGITQSSYTLATFASTTLSLSNFTLISPAGYTGTLVETANSLSVDLVFHGQLPHQSSILPPDYSSTSTSQTLDSTASDPISTADSSTLITSQTTDSSTLAPAPTVDSSTLDSTPLIESSPLIASPTDNSSGLSSAPLFVAPEPGSAALLAFGVTALLGRRQRRRR